MKPFFYAAALAITFLIGSPFVNADTVLSQDITRSTRLTLRGSPYLVATEYRQGLVVNERATLTVDPGVVVRFRHGNGLFVKGKLNASGTARRPIVFTSEHDTGNLSDNPAPGSWYGIIIKSNGSALRHVQVRYAGERGFQDHGEPFSLKLMGRHTDLTDSRIEKGLGIGLWLHYFYYGKVDRNVIESHSGHGVVAIHSEIDLFQNVIQGNEGHGILMESAGDIHGSIIRQNGMDGIHVDTASAPHLHDNAIRRNGWAGIRVEKGLPYIHHNEIRSNEDGVVLRRNLPVRIQENNLKGNVRYGMLIEEYDPDYAFVDARGNWWGDPNGPGIEESAVVFQNRDNVGSQIQFAPFAGRAVELDFNR